MAVDSNKTGQSIADFVIASKKPAGTPATVADVEALWKGIMSIIYIDLAADGVILPDTFTDSLSVLITGTGKFS